MVFCSYSEDMIIEYNGVVVSWTIQIRISQLLGYSNASYPSIIMGACSWVGPESRGLDGIRL